MLSGVEKFNMWVKKEKIQKGADYDWRTDYMLLGSDVQALFPSLSAERSSKAVRAQIEKSKLEWKNVDDKWVRLYIHLNRELTDDIKEIEHLLPTRRKGRKGVEAGMGSKECSERYVRDNEQDSNWTWPSEVVKRSDLKKLIAIIMEIAVKFFFKNFTYTFGGLDYLQAFGGPIGA